MSYYWLNRKYLFKKADDKYHNEDGKEKAAEYYKKNKEAIKKEKGTSTK